jgi:hypothetical protein
LLGTEIPPLIFFDNNSVIEVIDGRQRFETIMRFMENKFSLKPKGLHNLTLLKNRSYGDLAKHDRDIIDKFLDAKLRIIEFKLVNEPPLDRYLEDRIKKEIFSRYNSGITPLKKAEIDNAVYDSDALSEAFKDYFENNPDRIRQMSDTFFKTRGLNPNDIPTENIMTFIRKSLILPMTPITYYARGTGRTDLLTKLYEKLSDDSVNYENDVISAFIRKVDFIIQVKDYAARNSLESNRLALECFLWGLGILGLEDIAIEYTDDLVTDIAMFIHCNIDSYTEQDYSFNKVVLTRYTKTAEFLTSRYHIDTSLYVKPDILKREEIKELIKPSDTSTKLSELESLRLNKPEPSRISIDDVVRLMNKRRFLVRPSYQRKEVINPTKASSIIESILLGITLPAIFIYKREDGVSEVIDGQQRLLTLLGYIGAEYNDEQGTLQMSKNHRFALKKLKILKELDGKKFDALTEEQRNKIYDFPLYLVEIDEMSNPQFNPIDLFIRLNDKPYPIRENSFEMWNSWVDVDVINSIKALKKGTEEWFNLKQLRTANDRDRMENEELITSLIFLEYELFSFNTRRTLEVYQKTDRLNARIGNKQSITNMLLELTESNKDSKSNYEDAIKRIRSFIKKVKYVLLDKDTSKDQLHSYLRSELDKVLKAGKNPKYYRRTMQDFYFLWYIIGDINFEMVKHHRINMKEQIKELYTYMKNIPADNNHGNTGLIIFEGMLRDFKSLYRISERSISLTESEKMKMIEAQKNTSSISGAPIFLGDDIEIDHEYPISKGGKDDFDNLRIVHKDENRSKGSKI